MKKILIISIIITLLMFNIASANQNDDNKIRLEKLLELNNIEFEDIEINDDMITVSIETGNADKYDSQIAAWWGGIFGNAALLKGDDEDYKYIVIQNNINEEPVAYISANKVSVLDYIQGRIDDSIFWNEVTITSEKPSESEIEENAMLPSETLTTKNEYPDSDNKLWLWVLIIIIFAIILIVLIKKKKSKHKKEDKKSKTNKKENHKQNHKENDKEKIKTKHDKKEKSESSKEKSKEKQ